LGRPVVLSNGQLFVGLNKHGLVHDFYYPYVGLNNLTTTRSERHKIGIWVDGCFSWVNDGTWEINVDFESDALISLITVKNKEMALELQFQDFVDPTVNAFCRHIKIANRSDRQRDIRVFMHQVFQISHAGRGDTALYVPDGNYLLDYKGRCSLLIYAEGSDGLPFEQYAVGNCGIEGKEGTFKDAEDGELSGNAVEHGGVDSVLRLSLRLGANQAKVIDYWVVAAPSQQDAEKIHETLKKDGMVARLRAAREWWQNWLATGKDKLEKLDSNYCVHVKKSLLIIKAHVDRRGGILASGDSSIFNYGRDYYCYCWPRDGAYAVWPLIRLGFKDEARKFFEFCRDTLHEDGYLMHKYQPDRAIGSTWHPLMHNNRRELAIQEDETAIVIIMVGEYLKHSNDRDFVELLYDTLIRPATSFMANFIDDATSLPHASYDLWEEKFLTTTYTTATVYAALKIAARMAELFNYPDDAVRWREVADRIENALPLLYDMEAQAYRKGLLLNPNGNVTYDNTLDLSSFYGMMMFGPKKYKEETDNTAILIKKTLHNKTFSGGVPRYSDDNYMRTNPEVVGNSWFICTLWLAQYAAENAQKQQAAETLAWVTSKSLPSGVLSEQVDADTGNQASVAPLVWSHAEYVNTVLDLSGI
jgi:GH15 family glucan-1,4-alpha-glucosidase